jgi:hypothetical protein
MRWLGSFVLVVAVSGCGNNNKGSDMSTGMDLSMTVDMTTSGDGGGGGDACDVGKQTGCATGQKCALVQGGTAMMPTIVAACVTGGGTTAIGSTCSRGAGGLGDDTCVDGAECTSLSNATGSFSCRKNCDKDTDCTGGQLCVGINTAFTMGYCLTPCTIGGCTGGLTCAEVAFSTMNTMTSNIGFLFCRSPGMTPFFTDCMQDRDCVANAWCFPQANMGLGCQPVCDATHACTPQPPGTPDSGADADAGVGISCIPFDNSGATGTGLCL